MAQASSPNLSDLENTPCQCHVPRGIPPQEPGQVGGVANIWPARRRVVVERGHSWLFLIFFQETQPTGSFCCLPHHPHGAGRGRKLLPAPCLPLGPQKPGQAFPSRQPTSASQNIRLTGHCEDSKCFVNLRASLAARGGGPVSRPWPSPLVPAFSSGVPSSIVHSSTFSLIPSFFMCPSIHPS